MKEIEVQIINKSNNNLPSYATNFSAGVDLMVWNPKLGIDDKILVHPHQRLLIGTGLYVAIPEGYEIQIRPRSGLALKKGITVLNTPGTIDSDYRGEIGVIIMNHSDESVAFSNGDKIAQAILTPVEQIKWRPVEVLPTTERGEGGFGSSDINKSLEKPVY